MSVGYLETRLVGNYIQMWQTSEPRTPPPLLPLPLLFRMLNEISPICGGNSVAHPSQNMSDVIPLTSPGSSPNRLPPPPPHLCPVSSPKADEGGNGPKWCSWEWVDYYRRSQFTSGFPNKRDVIAATIHLWRRENIRFGGEEEKSRALNQTQTGLRRGWGADWKAQVIPAPAFAAIGLWETSITLSRSGRRLRRMSETTASLQAQGKWPVAEKWSWRSKERLHELYIFPTADLVINPIPT